MKSRFQIATGAGKFDQMLGGGPESCTITETWHREDTTTYDLLLHMALDVTIFFRTGHRMKLLLAFLRKSLANSAAVKRSFAIPWQ